MARVLIVGCGHRGLALASELIAGGHAVRGTTRDAGRLAEIEAAGVDAVLADPDRVATLVPALADVAILCLLLGCAAGDLDQLRALHTTRLQMLLDRILDTTVRGVVYEAAGTVDATLLQHGAAVLQAGCARSRIPFRLLYGTGEGWPVEAADAVNTLLRG